MADETFVIDPRDFITGPFIQCPFCPAEEFGVLMVNDRSYTRRCRSCMGTENYSLPELEKQSSTSTSPSSAS